MLILKGTTCMAHFWARFISQRKLTEVNRQNKGTYLRYFYIYANINRNLRYWYCRDFEI